MKLNTLLSTLAVSGGLLTGASAQFNTLTPWGDAAGTTPPASATVTFTADSSGVTTITAGGADFWGDADQGAFLWNNSGAYSTTGDFTATVRHVSTSTPAPEWGRDGILVRSTSTAGVANIGAPPAANDPNFMVFRKSNGTFETGIRDVRAGGTGDATNGINGGGIATGSVATTGWFMAAARNGNIMQSGMAIDLNGTAGRWVLHSTQTGINWDAGQQVIVGLGHQSHPQSITPDSNDINTATFNNWNYQGSYNAARFGEAAGAGANPWSVGSAINVNPSTGAVNGRAYVTQGGAATGEATKWTVTASQVLPVQPGLNTRIFLSSSNSLASAQGVIGGIPAGTTVIPNVDWTGNNGTSATNTQQYNRGEVGDFSLAVPGAFAGPNQDNYTVHMRGQIFIGDDASRNNIESVLFKDGIDDFTYLNIDGQTIINDNGWTNYEGTANGGSPIATLNTSDAKYNDGEWVSFEMIMSEGGGGDAGVLYWNQNGGPGVGAGFPATQTAPATTAAIVPAANFRYNPDGATQMAMGFTQVGTDTTDGSFGLTLTPGDYNVTVTVQNTGTSTSSSQFVTVVPEPSTPLFIGLGAMAFLLRRRNRR